MKRKLISTLIFMTVITFMLFAFTNQGVASLHQLQTENVPSDCESASNSDCTSSNGNIYIGYKKKGKTIAFR